MGRRKTAVIPATSTSVTAPQTVTKKREALKAIQPKGEDGTTLLSFEHSDFCVTVPLPIEMIKETAKKTGLKSRTVLEIGGLKIGLDIL